MNSIVSATAVSLVATGLVGNALPAIGEAAAIDPAKQPPLTPAEFNKIIAGAIADIRLRELSHKLEAVLVEWIAERRLNIQEDAAFDAAAASAGFPDVEYGELPPEKYLEYKHKRCEAAWAIVGPFRDPDFENWERIGDKLWPIVNEIMAVEAPTIEGFAVQVRAMTAAYAEYWQDCGDSRLLQFFEAACALTDVTPVELEAKAAVDDLSAAAG